MTVKRSLLDHIPAELPEELSERLCGSRRIRIERIVSRGHSSPEHSWYDQDTNEFVLLVKGRAEVEFEGRKSIVELKPGDWLDIKARVKHRVKRTVSGRDTIWLVVHY